MACVAYALFCFVLAVSLEAFGIAESFLLATLAALATQAVALTVTWRRREPAVEPPEAVSARCRPRTAARR